MNCPKCNVQIPFKKTRCDHCGQDLSTYRKIVSVSNMYYNDGLAKAKVRDLSGAILSLRKSLQFNKMNTSARNLLGLVYYEMGEIVTALSEWVISKYLQPEGNDADLYIDTIQSNPNKLDSVNQTIKKYNTALNAAKHGDEDMAIIQLKKVVNANPKFVRAHQLLALLYMMTSDVDERNKERAIKCLKRVRRVDVNNTVTLKYLRELGISPSPVTNKVSVTGPDALGSKKTTARDDTATFTPITPYKDDKPNILPLVNLLIGVMVGLAFSYFLIFPTMRNKISNSDSDNFKKVSSQVTELESDNSSLKNENAQLQEQITELQDEIKQYEEDGSGNLETIYTNLLEAYQHYQKQEYTKAADKLVAIDESKLTSDVAKEFHKTVKDNTYKKAGEDYLAKGRESFNANNFDEAMKSFEKAITFDDQAVYAIYLLGRCYQEKDDSKNAKKYFKQVVEKFPDDQYAVEANNRLREMDAE